MFINMEKWVAVFMIMAQILFPSLGQQTSVGVTPIDTTLSSINQETTASEISGTGKPSNSSLESTTEDDSIGMAIFLPFCENRAVQMCMYTPIKQCDECSMVGAAIFGAIVVLVGLGVLFGNGLVIIIFAKDQSSFTGVYGKIKVSLAFSDFLTGLLFLVVILPNFVKTLSQTSLDIFNEWFTLYGSDTAYFAGIFHILVYTSSFYHLVLLAQQRLYAVAFPIRYQQQNENSVYLGIAIVWLTSFVIAMFPLFVSEITYVYDCVIFLYSASSHRYMKLYFSFMTVFPYTIMAVFTLTTGVFLRRNLKKHKNFRASRKGSKKNNDVMVFVTLMLMVLGLTVTTGPYIIGVYLEMTGYWNAANFPLVFVVCYYLALTNSVVNVLVYSVVDKKFRKAARNLLRSMCCLKKETEGRESESNQMFSQRTLVSRMESHEQ